MHHSSHKLEVPDAETPSTADRQALLLLDISHVVRRYYDCEEYYVLAQYVVELMQSARPRPIMVRLLTPFLGHVAEIFLSEVDQCIRASEACRISHRQNTIGLR